MDRINRLIIKAKRAAKRKAERLFMGFVECGEWLAKGDLWTGKRGDTRRIITEHATKEAAVEAFRVLAAAGGGTEAGWGIRTAGV